MSSRTTGTPAPPAAPPWVPIEPPDLSEEERRWHDGLLALREEDARVRAVFAERPIEPPPPPPADSGAFALYWRPSERAAEEKGRPVQQLWQDGTILRTMQDYCEDADADHVLGVMLQAGAGKSTSGVRLAQWAARKGRRVLWVSRAHVSFEDLRGVQGFEPAMWYQWQPMDDASCRYVDHQREWSTRGHASPDLCWQVCGEHKDNWMKNGCPYRAQAERVEPIVFAMHQHLAHGLALSDFALVIVDELPLGAFVNTKHIITPPGLRSAASGYMAKLAHRLAQLAEEVDRSGEEMRGRALFDEIGFMLAPIYHQLETKGIEFAPPPRVRTPDQVFNVRWEYALDFLRLARVEYEAWAHGWSKWAERVRIVPTTRGRPGGLQLLTRLEPWEKLPNKMVVLDATGEPEIYRMIFRRPFRSYAPPIEMQGRIFQVAGSLYGAGTVTDANGDPTDAAHRLLAWTRDIARHYDGRRVSVITHKSIRHLFDEEFGAENVLHFYHVRGSNVFEDSACVIVAGTPAAPPAHVEDIVLALDPERAEALVGRWVHAEAEYRIVAELAAANQERVPFRRIGGYDDPKLAAVHEQLARSELVQALHRGRPVSRPDVDVWLISSTPTDEPLSGIGDRPGGNGTREEEYVSGLPLLAPEKIPYVAWLRLAPFLDASWSAGVSVGATEIAAGLGYSITHVRKNRWLRQIMAHEERWKWEDDPAFPSKRGPSVQRLQPALYS